METIFKWKDFDETKNFCETKFPSYKFSHKLNINDFVSLFNDKFGPNDFIKQIENWDDHDYGLVPLSSSFFTDLLFDKDLLQQTDVFYIVVDSSYNDNRVLEVKSEQLLQFIANSEDLTGINLFNNSDVIFISKDVFSVSYLSHYGQYMSMRNYLMMVEKS